MFINISLVIFQFSYSTSYCVQLKQCQQQLSPSTYCLACPSSHSALHTDSGGRRDSSLNWISVHKSENMLRENVLKASPLYWIVRDRFAYNLINARNFFRSTHFIDTLQYLQIARIVLDLLSKSSFSAPSWYWPTLIQRYWPGSTCLKCRMLYRAGPSPFASKWNSSPLRPASQYYILYFVSVITRLIKRLPSIPDGEVRVQVRILYFIISF